LECLVSVGGVLTLAYPVYNICLDGALERCEKFDVGNVLIQTGYAKSSAMFVDESVGLAC